MQTDFIVLHLSDTHMGIPKRKLQRDEVFDELFNDFEELSLKPNLIIFSGDLVWGELSNLRIVDQFEIANLWIEKLYEALQISQEDIPMIFSIGNHDMDRIHRDLSHNLFIDNLSNTGLIYDLMESNEITWKNIINYQQGWKNFVMNQMNSDTEFDENINCHYTKIKYANRKIGVAGLNSSWASYQDEEKGKLWIGEYQIDKILRNFQDCDFKILVTHHPVSWLNSCESNCIGQKIQTSFNLHYYGHEHDAWYQAIDNHLKIAAGPCYQESEKENGYSWSKINFKSKKCELILREYTKKSSKWKPMVIRSLTDDMGRTIINNMFANELKEKDCGPDAKIQKKRTTKAEGKPNITSMNVSEFVAVLTDKFSFRWEPHSIPPQKTKTYIYWPIRLRKPNPIHAVQTFIAAGLQQVDCKIILSLDNLGNTEINEGEFYKSIKRWFKKVGGDFSQVNTPLCEETINTSDKVWVLLQDWFKNGSVRMQDVLLVTKLINEFELETKINDNLSNRKPKRLMTPAVVWGCLLSIIDGNACGCDISDIDGNEWYITLGGYDERNLWKTGREKTEQFNGIRISHLFNPEIFLSDQESNLTLVLSEKSHLLEWDAEEDILMALQEDYANYHTPGYEPEKSMIHWVISGCILLPSYLTGRNSADFLNSIGVDSWNPKERYDLSNKLEIIAKEVSNWIIS
jgi:predicted MPP superfamily phosphohydrolase